MHFDWLVDVVVTYATAAYVVSGSLPGSGQMFIRYANICFGETYTCINISCLEPTMQALLCLGLHSVVCWKSKFILNFFLGILIF